MRIYIVTVIRNGFETVSQEGYDSLEKAQAFIESRAEKPWQINPWYYWSNGKHGFADYMIHDILVR